MILKNIKHSSLTPFSQPLKSKINKDRNISVKEDIQPFFKVSTVLSLSLVFTKISIIRLKLKES